MKLHGKAKTAVVAISGIVIAGAFICANAYRIHSSDNTEILYKETQVERGNLTAGVTESGSVSIGAISQDLDDLGTIIGSSSSASSTGNGNTNGMSASLSADAGVSGSANSSEGLLVEEIYVNPGQEIKTGDVLLKLTEESVSEYRENLQKEVKTAELALKEANLNAKSTQLSAQYSYNSNIANGSVAQSEYDTTVSNLQAAVDLAQAEANASAEKIADYQKRIAKGENCSAALAEEQANYNVCLSKLQSAKNSQITKTAEARQKYEEAVLKYQNAGNLYEIDTSGIDTVIEEAQENLDEANENLEIFESLIGDGKIYAQYTGTLSSVGYAVGDALSSSTDVAVFENNEEVTMTVSVSQEDISDVSIGDDVEIELTAYEDKVFEGKVETMDLSATSGSATVSYNVTVVFTGDVSDVYQDMTGNVTFVTSQRKDVLYISNKAVLFEGVASYVNVKNENGDIEKTEVITGFSDGVNVEISSGLEEGQTVLIESQVKSQ